MITALSVHEADVLFSLADPSGAVRATVPRDAWEAAGAHFAVGAGVVLRGVSAFSPAPGSVYLNVLPRHIVRIVPAQARLRPWRPSSGGETSMAGTSCPHSHDVQR